MASCDWSEIPQEILVSIARRLHSVTDYLCATQACKTWRSISLPPHNHLPIPRPPFLLLAEPNPNPNKKTMKIEADEDLEWEESPVWISEDEEEEEEEECVDDEEIPFRGIVGLGSDKIWELHLPELHHNRCVGSTGNWLIIVNKEQQVNIFNPFARTQFQLPPQSTIPDPMNSNVHITPADLRDRFLSKVVLSSTPKSPDGVVAATIYGAIDRIAFARPGDQSWITIERIVPCESCVHDVIFLRNRLYFIGSSGMLVSYHGFDSPTDPITITATQLSDDFRNPARSFKHYLVEWLGELLLVRRNRLRRSRFPYYKTKEFQVFKFDFDNAEWEQVRSLGQHSLFLGFNTSVSLLASPDSSSPFQKNCIYFTDDHMLGYFGHKTEGGHDMGVYNLEEGTLQPHYAGISISMYSPPLWIIPTCFSQA